MVNLCALFFFLFILLQEHLYCHLQLYFATLVTKHLQHTKIFSSILFNIYMEGVPINNLHILALDTLMYTSIQKNMTRTCFTISECLNKLQ